MLCAVTVPHADLRSLSLYYYAVCGRMCMSSVRVWCSCLLVICLSADKVHGATLKSLPYFGLSSCEVCFAVDNGKIIVND